MTKPTNHDNPTEQIAAHIINAGRAADAALGEHANPSIQAQIAQAHALTAIALLLQQLLDTINNPTDDQPYQTVHIVGGWPNQRQH